MAQAWPAEAAPACSDHDSCVNALQGLQNQYAQKQKAISSTQKTAAGYKEAFQGLQAQFQATTQKITKTQEQISQTGDDIDAITRTIDNDKDHIAKLQGLIHQEILALYQKSQLSTVEIFLSGQTLAEALADTQSIQDIQDDIQQRMKELGDAKAELEDKKAQLVEKQGSLHELADRLNGDKADLSEQKHEVNTLLTSTQSQLRTYVSQQRAIKQQIAETQRRLRDLINEAHWGSDIVSAPPEGWTYNQLNYPQTLGNSWYTVHDYGCLVTSLAMVTSFWGHHVTPAQIADNASYFTRGGYARVDELTAGIGLSVQERGPVNWGEIDAELLAGRPVVVSIFIPQVGVINSDGSSHFIVIQKKAGKTYLMQDPLGSDRSYGLQYVRSMFILNKG